MALVCAHVLWSALDRLGVDAPILVGHSMGAQIAVEMALPDSTFEDVVPLGATNYASERGPWRHAIRLGQDILRKPPSVNAIVFTDCVLRCGPR